MQIKTKPNKINKLNFIPFITHHTHQTSVKDSGVHSRGPVVVLALVADSLKWLSPFKRSKDRAIVGSLPGGRQLLSSDLRQVTYTPECLGLDRFFCELDLVERRRMSFLSLDNSLRRYINSINNYYLLCFWLWFV